VRLRIVPHTMGGALAGAGAPLPSEQIAQPPLTQLPTVARHSPIWRQRINQPYSGTVPAGLVYSHLAKLQPHVTQLPPPAVIARHLTAIASYS
jgi:hypothetical protein